MKIVKEKLTSANLARLSESEIVSKNDDLSSSYLGVSRSRIFDSDIANRVTNLE